MERGISSAAPVHVGLISTTVETCGGVAVGEYTRIEDLEVIRGMGRGLGNIKKSFDGLEDLKGKYDEDFGNSDLKDKFEDFVDNWKLSRKELTEEIDALSKIAKAAAGAYEDIDQQLADAIRGAQAPKKGNRG
ncbi:hypothetical protein O1Q96_04500 [Streptomyces sp. Qhu-G9]|uniref:hypothetical protein n=1 Tax=Streptomyces sp. Qhu-G9 TaxID=3452799 RepID=UPI0022AC83E9|nr:hypothetical protein [Streptomyces aurantiacus]WAU79076.1 hypothetical protein O1Q96_04500 [Streptomyces aurantiacus]